LTGRREGENAPSMLKENASNMMRILFPYFPYLIS
jgi:hypothetical protein